MFDKKGKDGTIEGLREFYGRDFQEYEPGKVFRPFYTTPGGHSCGNPIIIGFIKTGRLAWMEQWIEVCKCADNGKYGWACNTASDSCEGHNRAQFPSRCFFKLPHQNYKRFYCYDSAEDAIRGAIAAISDALDRAGDSDNKGTRKMVSLAKQQLRQKEPEIIELNLFEI